MKKIITVVLALVMVFALAAPALALTNDPPSAVTGSNGAYTMTGMALSTAPTFGPSFNMQQAPANQAWKSGEMVYYYFGINVASNFTLAPTNAAHTQMKFRIAGNGVNIVSVYSANNTFYAFDNSVNPYSLTGVFAAMANQPPVSNNTAANTLTYDMFKLAASAPATANDIFYLQRTGVNNGQFAYVGMGIMTSAVASPTITANVGLLSLTPNSVYNLNTINGKAATLTKTNAGGFNIYTIALAGGNSMVIYANETTFKTGDVLYNGDKLTMSNAATSGYNAAYDFVLNGTTPADATQKAEIVAILNYFGFDFALAATGSVRDGHFLAGINVPSASATISVPLNNAAITVPPVDPGVVPPKTGDAATTAGFIMMGIAILAAAGLVIKKVRA